MKNKTTMRNFYLFAVMGVLMVTFLLTGPDAIHSQARKKEPVFKAVSPRGCTIASWAPEVISFYGDSTTVMAKLNNFEMSLPDRRIYMFLVESADSAELSLFELAREKENKFKVWHWKGQSASKLREDATNTILANRGVACVGEQIKRLVKDLNPEDKGEIPAPTSASAAFGHVIRGFGKEYIRTTVFLLC